MRHLSARVVTSYAPGNRALIDDEPCPRPSTARTLIDASLAPLPSDQVPASATAAGTASAVPRPPVRTIAVTTATAPTARASAIQGGWAAPATCPSCLAPTIVRAMVGVSTVFALASSAGLSPTARAHRVPRAAQATASATAARALATTATRAKHALPTSALTIAAATASARRLAAASVEMAGGGRAARRRHARAVCGPHRAVGGGAATRAESAPGTGSARAMPAGAAKTVRSQT